MTKSPATPQQFLAAIEPHRDRIYALARALAPDAATAENLLHRAVHQGFAEYAQKMAPDFLPWFEAQMRAIVPTTQERATPERRAMPAALWARIHAAVQIEAAKRGGLAAGDSLLAYDPLLAPRKTQPPLEEPLDGLGLLPATRFVLVASIALIVAIVLTIVLTTRKKHPTPPALPTTTFSTSAGSQESLTR